jgi:hypothetical protein
MSRFGFLQNSLSAPIEVLAEAMCAANNPRNCQYNEPDSYRSNSYCHPGSVYPNFKYDGGLCCSLLHDGTPSLKEKYPPGTPVKRIDPSMNMLLAGMVMDIPFPQEINGNESMFHYMVLFDNESTAFTPLSEMAAIIPSPQVHVNALDSQDSLLPLFL